MILNKVLRYNFNIIYNKTLNKYCNIDINRAYAGMLYQNIKLIYII